MNRIQIIPGLEITDISLGAGGRGYIDKDAAQFEIMDKYLELGGNCFDTARKYVEGECDVSLGKYFASRGNRDRVILCTKGNHPLDTQAMHISRLSKEDIEQDLNESLRAIGTDHTDLHLLHRDDPKLPVGPIVEALHGLVKAGKARAVGVSNWTVGRIQEAIEYARANGLTAPSVCQLHFSLLETSAPQTQDLTHVPMNGYEFGWYEENRFPVMCFGSQGRGFFARYAAGLDQKPGSMQYYGHLPGNLRRADRLIQLSNELGISVAALATAYVRDHRLKASVLCAFSSVDQLMNSMQALNFRMTPEQIRFLETGER